MKKAALQNCLKNGNTVWPVGHLLIESFHGSLKIKLVLTNSPGTSWWHVLPSPDQARSGARVLIIDESADETLFCYRVGRAETGYDQSQ